MPTNLDRASLISRHVELESISLAEATLHTSFDPLASPESVQLSQRYRTHYELPDARPDHVYVSVELKLEAAEPHNEVPARELLQLEATYLAIYRLTGAATYPSDALEHFASLNGPYNVWPYWRELIQTVTGRVGLGGLVLPVFRPPIREVDDQEELPFEEQEGASRAVEA